MNQNNPQGPPGPFHVDFNIYTYSDILPKLSEYLEHDEIINQEHRDKGNIEKMVWKRHTPTTGEISSKDFRTQEIRRVLKTGAWVWIKDYPMWIPPNYYFALTYGAAGAGPMEFRLKRLKHVYFKIRARNTAACKGTFTVKNRGDGETTMAVTDGMWECMDGIMDVGQVGLQSKTRNDAFNPCWMYVQTLWQSLEPWIKEELYSDFSSGENIAEKLRFQRNADVQRGRRARNVLMTYYPAVFDAMDGKHDVKKCILDEVLKWVECNFGDSLTCYSKFIMPGFERRGMFDIFSSPAAKDCQSYREGYELWEKSDPSVITAMGSTTSGIHRWYSNPLEGIHGAYDGYGDAEPNRIYDFIMAQRAAAAKDKKLEETRAFPLNDEEMWGSIEGGSVWSNTQGMKDRKVYLIGTRFKDANKEPRVIYGNLERVDGYIDGDVEFRQADIDHFDLEQARFAFSYLPQNKEQLKRDENGIFLPPRYVENCLGVDPFNLRYGPKDTRGSDAAMVNRKFLDLFETGVNKCPTMIYCCRTPHQETMFEDALKAAIYNRALLQYENKSDKLANHAEDRGYSKWLLPGIGERDDSKRKGDGPSGRGRFLEEGMSLLNAATNTPLPGTGDEYRLEKYWFVELIADYLMFRPKNTQASNLTMADMQALIGAVKILHKKIRKPSGLNDAVVDYLLG